MTVRMLFIAGHFHKAEPDDGEEVARFDFASIHDLIDYRCDEIQADLGHDLEAYARRIDELIHWEMRRIIRGDKTRGIFGEFAFLQHLVNKRMSERVEEMSAHIMMMSGAQWSPEQVIGHKRVEWNPNDYGVMRVRGEEP